MKTVILTVILVMSCQISHAVEKKVIETIIYESSNQSFKGQVAVASVIKTRMKQRRKTAKQIILQPKQISCWKNGKPTQKRSIKERERKTAIKAWNKSKPSKFNHYCRFDCKPYWIKKAKSSVRIGSHIFYEL